MKYKVIYADPPWQYQDRTIRGAADYHYPTMTTPEICALPIADIADPDSVLLMWTTYPMLQEAFKVVDAWGFTYKTVAFTWVKTTKTETIHIGTGRYTRANAELCFLATKGKGVPRVDASIPNTQYHKRQEHSRKPAKFRNDIVRLFGDVPRIELFARDRVEGWDVWGNETPPSTQKLLVGVV